MSTAAPLIEYLNQLQAKGGTHVSLDEKARLILRKFYVRAVQEGQPKVIEQAKPTHAPAAPAKTVKVEAKAPVFTKPQIVSGSTYGEMFASLRKSCESYGPLSQLMSLRKTIVFPQAPLATDIMFCGEAPGYHDEREGLPFSGPAGEKLNGILKAMGLSRELVHVTNVLKYRPAIPNQTTNNRPASPEELEVARPLIDQEIKAIQPKVIVTLGSYAARFFTGASDEDEIDEIRAGKHHYGGVPVVPTYHPSFLLHTQDTKDKRALWEDMLEVMAVLAMPISDRQRGYYAPKEA